tara:strand:- start:477 stop:803 length:327 start_codon:yes stop_codon:yes gene_type:complete
MIKIMFLKLKNDINLLNLKSMNLINECYAYVQSYDTKNNIVKISNNKNENKSRLFGKLFYLDVTLCEALQIINSIPDIQISGRDKYYLEVVDVTLADGSIENDVYIIL